MDIFVSRLSPRKRALLDLFTGALVIIGIGLLLWKVGANAWWSLANQEHYTSSWSPPIYPLKMAMTIGIGTMLLQAIACWIRNLEVLRRREGGKKEWT